jgi:hypothetical protein
LPSLLNLNMLKNGDSWLPFDSDESRGRRDLRVAPEIHEEVSDAVYVRATLALGPDEGGDGDCAVDDAEDFA